MLKFLSAFSDAKVQLVGSFLLFTVGILVLSIFVVFQEWHVFVVSIADSICPREMVVNPYSIVEDFTGLGPMVFPFLLKGFPHKNLVS